MGWHRAFPPGQETTCNLQSIAEMFNLDHVMNFCCMIEQWKQLSIFYCIHESQLYRNVRNADKFLADMCSLFCSWGNLYYSVSCQPGKGKCPFPSYLLSPALNKINGFCITMWDILVYSCVHKVIEKGGRKFNLTLLSPPLKLGRHISSSKKYMF